MLGEITIYDLYYSLTIKKNNKKKLIYKNKNKITKWVEIG
jgi:hypothetical protein